MNQQSDTAGTITGPQANGVSTNIPGGNGLVGLATSQNGSDAYAGVGNPGLPGLATALAANAGGNEANAGNNNYAASQKKLPQTGDDSAATAASMVFGLLGVALAGAGVAKKRYYN